jgi:hypothetical protein
MSNSVVPITGAPHLVISRRHDDMRWPRGPVDTELLNRFTGTADRKALPWPPPHAPPHLQADDLIAFFGICKPGFVKYAKNC